MPGQGARGSCLYIHIYIRCYIYLYIVIYYCLVMPGQGARGPGVSDVAQKLRVVGQDLRRLQGVYIYIYIYIYIYFAVFKIYIHI